MSKRSVFLGIMCFVAAGIPTARAATFSADRVSVQMNLPADFTPFPGMNGTLLTAIESAKSDNPPVFTISVIDSGLPSDFAREKSIQRSYSDGLKELFQSRHLTDISINEPSTESINRKPVVVFKACYEDNGREMRETVFLLDAGKNTTLSIVLRAPARDYDRLLTRFRNQLGQMKVAAP